MTVALFINGCTIYLRGCGGKKFQKENAERKKKIAERNWKRRERERERELYAQCCHFSLRCHTIVCSELLPTLLRIPVGMRSKIFSTIYSEKLYYILQYYKICLLSMDAVYTNYNIFLK